MNSETSHIVNNKLDYFLEKTSRTFAICIPILPAPVREQVTLAYLMFRIVDTYEDAYDWPPAQRVEALQIFSSLMDQQESPEAFASLATRYEQPPTTHEGYAELLAATPWIIEQFYALPASVQTIIWSHLRRTVEGMIHFLQATNESWQVHLKSLAELEHYCYTVAGIVGEMLTELFLLAPDGPAASSPHLLRLSSSLGNGLQLTNILKDESADHSEGRFFLPPSLHRKEIIELAQQKLRDGLEYIRELELRKVPQGIARACKLPTLLAQATISQVEAHGPGAKVSRTEVAAILAQVMGK